MDKKKHKALSGNIRNVMQKDRGKKTPTSVKSKVDDIPYKKRELIFLVM